MTKTTQKALFGYFFLFFVLAALLTLSAWTVRYWQAWVYLAVSFACYGAITIYLSKKDPALLARRTSVGFVAEKQKSQKVIQFIAQFTFVAVYVVPALDHRFSWSFVPVAGVVAANVLMAAGLYLVFLVFKENSFTSGTVEVGQDQKVITTGPYAKVRHPMYTGALLKLLMTPIALGSFWGLFTFIPMVFVIVWRLHEEEKYLAQSLPGYADYLKSVRWRLLPGIY